MKPRLHPRVVERVLRHACDRLDLGMVERWSGITVGFEDSTVMLTTTHAPHEYVVKIFSADRAHLAPRTATVIQAAQRVGATHPYLYAAPDGQVAHIAPDGLAYLLMDRVQGPDLYTLGRPPSPTELVQLIAQIARLHTLDVAVEPVTDPWAIPHLAATAQVVDRYLDTAHRPLVQAALHAIAQVDTAALPHAFIHGDLTQGNVLIDDRGRVVVIDYAVATRHPRIQELAVAAANLTAGDSLPLPERLAALATAYEQHHRLTDAEHAALPAYGLAAAAMEYLGALRAHHLEKNQDEETSHLLQIGRTSMSQAAQALTRR
ncbi:phosphotransferase [Nocardiopsis sp. EMB25]|uniref:phosphotransferase n=1 Tax=Nocardiopsis sp. EMB25 TaxID=2835867 RepID=UPI002284C77E|nr:phosphotransferase [Nocardiopsis sp. EMB25]MCY9787132.1 phosphotransferase [Nocardiopsis sp. EMB25]